jgi:hypothetical protein
MIADNNLQAPPAAAKKAQGAGYTRTEDYLVCKAFNAASEDLPEGKRLLKEDAQEVQGASYSAGLSGPAELFFCNS